MSACLETQRLVTLSLVLGLYGCWTQRTEQVTVDQSARLEPIRVARYSLTASGDERAYNLRLIPSSSCAPRELYVYRFHRPSMDEARMYRLAATAFGIADPFVRTNPTVGSYTLIGKMGHMVVRPRECLYRYTSREAEALAPKNELGVFTDDTAIELAGRFLRQVGLGEKEVALASILSRTTQGRLGEPDSRKVIERTCRFEGKVSGYPIQGRCMRIDVTVLSNGHIGGLEKCWFQVGPEKRAYPTRTVEQAYDFLLSGAARPIRTKFSGGECRLLEIVYVADDPYQEWLQPCYRFKITKGQASCFVKAPALSDECYLTLPALVEMDQMSEPSKGGAESKSAESDLPAQGSTGPE